MPSILFKEWTRMCPGCGARGCGCSSAPALTHWEFIPNTTPADTRTHPWGREGVVRLPRFRENCDERSIESRAV